jgi:hypothetical protein
MCESSLHVSRACPVAPCGREPDRHCAACFGDRRTQRIAMVAIPRNWLRIDEGNRILTTKNRDTWDRK